ncbi:MAG: NAD(P)-dependent glycerol-3-phosphate dehydrogenase [Nitrospinae bacterium]|nr:NAD(P)-dependent glycerol-3-phosphate dehydrogenase [Nitrospinota bacterium]
MNTTVTVIGGGAWGTALANLLGEKGVKVRLWVYESDLCQIIKERKENQFFLPGVKLSENISPYTSMEEASDGVRIFIIASPSHVLRGVIKGLKGHLPDDAVLVSVTKGIENDTLKLPSQIFEEILPAKINNRTAYLSGPTFAKEVVNRLPTAATIAAKDKEIAEYVQSLFNTAYFRIYTHSDILGVELGGAIKNVIAIAAGASDGLGFGNSARAALITRGLAEMVRLGIAMGAEPVTFTGLSGIGDLVLTCTGDLSRNRSVGIKLGQGMKLDEILKDMRMVAEGVKTTKSAYELGKKHKVELPIINEVYAILYEGKSPKDAVSNLMGRSLKKEF